MILIWFVIPANFFALSLVETQSMTGACRSAHQVHPSIIAGAGSVSSESWNSATEFELNNVLLTWNRQGRVKTEASISRHCIRSNKPHAHLGAFLSFYRMFHHPHESTDSLVLSFVRTLTASNHADRVKGLSGCESFACRPFSMLINFETTKEI